MASPPLRLIQLALLQTLLITLGCQFEEVHCEAAFMTDDMLAQPQQWDTQECTAQVLGDNITQVEIVANGQRLQLEIIGLLQPGTHEVHIEYADGRTTWKHDGQFEGTGPACTVTLEVASKEPWTQTDRVRASGTIDCPGKLTGQNPTTFEDEELGFLDASFDVFASDDSLGL